jgi:hypothetical protein
MQVPTPEPACVRTATLSNYFSAGPLLRDTVPVVIADYEQGAYLICKCT